jgi:formylglycine-generating enzyme required for sulfatase activity/tRNA A-37 threonylcarbamoyl transferase component Bud32
MAIERVLDRYEYDPQQDVLSERGGQGATYRVRDKGIPEHPQRVLKILKAEHQADAIQQKLFTDEARHLQKLVSCSYTPCLIQTTTSDTNMSSVKPMHVMDFIEGNTLENELKSSRVVASVLTLLSELLIIVQALHQTHKIIHSDLKPSNLIRERKTQKLYVVDFGASCEGESVSRPVRVLQAGDYAAPEQARGSLYWSSDLYAVGRIGMRAWFGKTIIDTEKWPLPIQDGKEGLESFLRYLTNASLDKRPKTVSDALARLELLLNPPQEIRQEGILGRMTASIRGRTSTKPVTAEPTVVRKEIRTPSIEVPKVDVKVPKAEPIFTFSEAPRITIPIPKISVSKSSYPLINQYISEMCKIPAGDFDMGGDKYTNEQPVHMVPISGFQLGKTPLTVGVWLEYCKATGTDLPKLPTGVRVWENGWNSILDHPIVNVSWDNCVTFCKWASDVSGLALELPSEAQWEYAARGGNKGWEYPWEGNFDKSKLWCSDKSYGDSGGTASVSRDKNIFVNGYDLLDMSGNVWEWCRDYYAEDWYKQSGASLRDAENIGHGKKESRVLRGGSWCFDFQGYLRCAFRNGYTPIGWDNYVGFRLSLPEPR